MAQQRYYYDPETCAFVEADEGPRYVGTRVIVAAAAAALVLVAGMVWAMDALWVTTPEEMALRSENEALQEQLEAVSGQMDAFSAQISALAETDRELYRTLLQAEPISDDVRQVGIGGTDAYASFDRYDAETADLLRSTAETLDQLERQITLQRASFQELTTLATVHQRRMDQLPSLLPADGIIISGFGMRHHPILNVRKMHEGIDLLLRHGSPIVAPGDGVVKRAGRSATYGKYIDINHPDAGYMTRFAHLSDIPSRVRRGRTVARGDTIGFSGNTGRSTGPHLHYEVRDEDGRPLNPMHFVAPDMTPSKYRTMLAKVRSMRAKTSG